MKKVLIIPDAFFTNQSGAIASREIARHFNQLGCKVDIYSPDSSGESMDNIENSYKRTYKQGLLNYDFKHCLEEFRQVLNVSKPDLVYLVSGVYPYGRIIIDECNRQNLKVMTICYTQDFFCVKKRSSVNNKPCSYCADATRSEISKRLYRFKNKCGIYSYKDYIIDFYRGKNLLKLRKSLANVTYMLGSSDEQLSFYQSYGVPKEKCKKIPLTFDKNRCKGIEPQIGDYFLCIAQEREEKGYQYIPQILSYCDDSIKVVIAYYNEQQANAAIEKYQMQKYIDCGMLRVVGSMNWETGLKELLANSRGVIQPTIWPTTTEFAFLEALGLKKPVFMFNLGVHKEIVINNVNGFVVPVGDCRAMSIQMKTLLDDDDLYYKVSDGAYKLYLSLTDDNTWKKIMNELIC